MRFETQRARRNTRESLSAWDLICEGMWHYYHFTREHHRQARQLFRRAIETDPAVAEGHIWLARCIDGTIFYGWTENAAADTVEEAEAVRQGMRLAEDDPYALFALANYCNLTNVPGRAIAAAQRAIDLSPSFALGHFILGVARLCAGRAAQAIEPLQRGLRLNPNDAQAFVWLHNMAVAHFQVGEHQEAAERAADAVALRPDSYFSQCILACSLAMLGRLGEAHVAAAELRRVLPQPHALDRYLARFIGPGDRERLAEGLRQAGWPLLS